MEPERKNKPSVNKLKLILFPLLAVVLLTLTDQLIKLLVYDKLRPIERIVIADRFLALTYVENRGAMMGLFGLSAKVMGIISLVVLCLLLVGSIVYIAKGKLSSLIVRVCITLIISGGIGNVIDRLVRGFVIDYIEFLFVDFYVFNFADMLITCSCFVLIIYELYTAITEKRKQAENA